MPKKKIQKFVTEEEQKVESEIKNLNQDGKDQENELGAKNEVAAKSETRALPSNQDEDESEGIQESATKQKNKMKKMMQQGNKRLDLQHQTKMRRNQRS